MNFNLISARCLKLVTVFFPIPLSKVGQLSATDKSFYGLSTVNESCFVRNTQYSKEALHCDLEKHTLGSAVAQW